MYDDAVMEIPPAIATGGNTFTVVSVVKNKTKCLGKLISGHVHSRKHCVPKYIWSRCDY